MKLHIMPSALPSVTDAPLLVSRALATEGIGSDWHLFVTGWEDLEETIETIVSIFASKGDASGIIILDKDTDNKHAVALDGIAFAAKRGSISVNDFTEGCQRYHRRQSFYSHSRYSGPRLVTLLKQWRQAMVEGNPTVSVDELTRIHIKLTEDLRRSL